MMPKEKLRQADFVTSIILLLFSFIELGMTFKMPMKDTYAGVNNTWYVSPALMPLFIGFALLILSCVLLRHSIRSGAAAQFINSIRAYKKGRLKDSTVSMLLILTAFGSFVYLTIPRIDFFLAILNFLFFFIVIFYFDNEEFKRKFGMIYFIGAVIFMVLCMTGLYEFVKSLFKYSFDMLFLISYIAQIIYCRSQAVKYNLQKKFKISWIVSLGTPLLLVPVFRYFLLVQLPYEGGIIKLLNLIYYQLR